MNRFHETYRWWQDGLKPDPLTEPIFVGRAIEISELIACLESVIDGKGRTVFISGEAGTGKTRLVKEFLKTIDRKKITLMVGWCLSNTPPYFPFVEAFGQYKTRDSDDIELVLPKKTRHELETASVALVEPAKEIVKSDGSSTKSWKDLTFATIARALQSAANFHPLLLFIDDLQWADSASLALLHYLSRALISEKVLIISTFRSEEINANQEGRHHPLIETMRLMRRDDLFKEINLSNLSQTNIVKVAEDMVGGNLDPDFSMKLAVESQGNPLFVVESMRMLLENKQLIQENGCFRLAAGELGIPTKVKDIILRRLDSLKPDQRKMLELASVIGEKFDPKLLSGATSVGILDVLEALNDVSASSSLVFSKDSFYSFDHAKSREVLYGELPLALRREYHTKIAEELERMSENGKNVTINDLAYHFAQAGKKEQALHYALIAGSNFWQSSAMRKQLTISFMFSKSLRTLQNIRRKETKLWKDWATPS